MSGGWLNSLNEIREERDQLRAEGLDALAGTVADWRFAVKRIVAMAVYGMALEVSDE